MNTVEIYQVGDEVTAVNACSLCLCLCASSGGRTDGTCHESGQAVLRLSLHMSESTS